MRHSGYLQQPQQPPQQPPQGPGGVQRVSLAAGALEGDDDTDCQVPNKTQAVEDVRHQEGCSLIFWKYCLVSQVTMRIPNDKIGRVIGKEGSTINKIRQVGLMNDLSVRVMHPNPKSHSHGLTSSCHHMVVINARCHRDGQESGCRIDIENHRVGDNAIRTIRMRGNLQQTQVAQQLISQRVGIYGRGPSLVTVHSIIRREISKEFDFDFGCIVLLVTDGLLNRCQLKVPLEPAIHHDFIKKIAAKVYPAQDSETQGDCRETDKYMKRRQGGWRTITIRAITGRNFDAASHKEGVGWDRGAMV